MNRSILLPILMGAVMSTVLVLPKAGKIAESAIRMKLPGELGEWTFQEEQATKKEVDILDKETQFSKARCYAPIPFSYQANGMRRLKIIDLSVVLSGTDINNSIHRPERCMPSQGHQIYDAHSSILTTPMGRSLPVRELTSMQVVTRADTGEKESHHCLTLYFFVGQKEITESHLWRTFIDIRDRVLRGQDQRWAYVSASLWFEDDEKSPRSRAIVEKEIRQFLTDLADRNINWAEINQTPKSL